MNTISSSSSYLDKQRMVTYIPTHPSTTQPHVYMCTCVSVPCPPIYHICTCVMCICQAKGSISYTSLIHGGSVLFVCDWMTVLAMKKSHAPPMHYNFSTTYNIVTCHQDANSNEAKLYCLSHTCNNAWFELQHCNVATWCAYLST